MGKDNKFFGIIAEPWCAVFSPFIFINYSNIYVIAMLIVVCNGLVMFVIDTV